MPKIRLIYFSLIVITCIGISCSRQPSSVVPHTQKPVGSVVQRSIGFNPDSLFIQKKIPSDYPYSKATVTEIEVKKSKVNITGLPKMKKEIDLQFPSYRPVFYPDFILPNVLPMPVILQITFDNDIFDETDYYYTNGVRIELTTPLAMDFHLRKVLPQLKNSDIFLTGFSLRQNMYTPTNPDVPIVLTGDHPFAGYLLFGQFVKTINYKKKLSLFSEFNLGVIGPASLAGTIQTSLHEIKPVGWKNQIQNDFIANFTVQLEKGVVSQPHIEMNLKALANAGTLHDNAALGIYVRAGSFIPVYRGVWFGKTGRKRNDLQYWFFAEGQTKGVLYDATLQGGLFSHSTYTIGTADINRVVFQASAGVALYYGVLGLELENFYQSPQFNGAKNFRYGRIMVVVRL